MYANHVRLPDVSGFILIILFFLGFITPVAAQTSSELAGFSTVWKLMTPEDRELFVSGYLRGWKDASEFLDIAAEYVKSNPEKASDSLSKLRDLANLGDQKPAPLSVFIDDFYKNPQNQGAPLSKAVSAARMKLQNELK